LLEVLPEQGDLRALVIRHACQLVEGVKIGLACCVGLAGYSYRKGELADHPDYFMGLVDAGVGLLKVAFADTDQPACHQECDDGKQQQPGYLAMYDDHFQ